MTPTARTLALMRRSGYLAAMVESWLRYANRRRDLFDCCDFFHQGCEGRGREVTTEGIPGLAGS
jgi:hypothetical protein